MIFITVKQSFFFQTADLSRKAASVYLKIIRKLLTVKWNIKAHDVLFLGYDRQIGQTGLTVRPKVYFACGISGQVQHIAGMQESGIIISINSDPNAPINAIADYVITGRVEDVLPKLISHYQKKS